MITMTITMTRILMMMLEGLVEWLSDGFFSCLFSLRGNMMVCMVVMLAQT